MTAAPESRARDTHPDFDRAVQRVGYIVELMANMRWERGVTAYELAEDWRIGVSLVENYSTEARRHLELLGQRENVLNIVRASAHRWVQQGDNDRVAAAKLLVDTVGGFTQKQELSVTLEQRPPAELVPGVLDWLEEVAPKELMERADRMRGLMLTEGEEHEA